MARELVTLANGKTVTCLTGDEAVDAMLLVALECARNGGEVAQGVVDGYNGKGHGTEIHG